MLQKRIVKLEQELAAANHKIAILVTRQEEPLDLPKVTEDIVMKSDKTVKFHTGLVSTKVMFTALLQFAVYLNTHCEDMPEPTAAIASNCTLLAGF